MINYIPNIGSTILTKLHNSAYSLNLFPIFQLILNSTMTSNGDASKDIFNEIRKQDMFMYYQNVFGGGGANGGSGGDNHNHPPAPHPPLHHHHHHQHLGPPGAHLLPSPIGVGGASSQEVNQACATAVAQVTDSHNSDLMLCTS